MIDLCAHPGVSTTNKASGSLVYTKWYSFSHQTSAFSCHAHIICRGKLKTRSKGFSIVVSGFFEILLTHLHCNIYAVQQDTQSVFNEWVLFSTYISSTYFGPHRSIIRSVSYKLYSQIWYVVIRVLLDNEVVERTSYNFVAAGRVK